MDNTPNIPEDVESDNPKDWIDALTPEQLEEAWEVEALSWMELGMNPGQNVGIDGFQLKSRVDILLQTLIALDILNEDELNDKVKRHMLVQMIILRKTHQRQMLQAKLMEGIKMPTPKPGMFLPPGMNDG